MSKNTGKVSQIIGPVVDVIFDNNEVGLPDIYDALEITREARDMMGANGLLEEYHIMRHLVNLETIKTYEGSEDIHTLILGKSQTNLNSF